MSNFIIPFWPGDFIVAPAPQPVANRHPGSATEHATKAALPFIVVDGRMFQAAAGWTPESGPHTYMLDGADFLPRIQGHDLYERWQQTATGTPGRAGVMLGAFQQAAAVQGAVTGYSEAWGHPGATAADMAMLWGGDRERFLQAIDNAGVPMLAEVWPDALAALGDLGLGQDVKGGPRSGFRGHRGRPGKRGGSQGNSEAPAPTQDAGEPQVLPMGDDTLYVIEKGQQVPTPAWDDECQTIMVAPARIYLATGWQYHDNVAQRAGVKAPEHAASVRFLRRRVDGKIQISCDTHWAGEWRQDYVSDETAEKAITHALSRLRTAGMPIDGEVRWTTLTGHNTTVTDLRDWLPAAQKGGPGSGFRGHAGRPGQRGGSQARGAEQSAEPPAPLGYKNDRAPADTVLRAYVRQLADLKDTGRGGTKYKSVEALLLADGSFFRPQPKPAGVRQGKPRLCYQNAYQLADRDPEKYAYCEGYAWPKGLPLGIEHAWAVDRATGRVVDNTWKDHGTSYFGVEIPLSYVHKVQQITGTYGVLPDAWRLDLLNTGIPAADEKGSPKSGNWGHVGRPGEVGGSQRGGGLGHIGLGKDASREDRQRHAHMRKISGITIEVDGDVPRPIRDAVYMALISTHVSETEGIQKVILHAGAGRGFETPDGREWQEGGNYDKQPGKPESVINIYGAGFPDFGTLGWRESWAASASDSQKWWANKIITHEVGHNVFERWWTRANEIDTDLYNKWSGNRRDAATDPNIRVSTVTGLPTPGWEGWFKNQTRLRAAQTKFINAWQQGQDGITPYSKSWHNWTETIAEMSAIEHRSRRETLRTVGKHEGASDLVDAYLEARDLLADDYQARHQKGAGTKDVRVRLIPANGIVPLDDLAQFAKDSNGVYDTGTVAGAARGSVMQPLNTAPATGERVRLVRVPR